MPRSPRPNISIREATVADEPLLREALYHAVFVPPGEEAPPRELVQQPALARYVDGWGRAGDSGVVASKGAGEVVGAAWVRLFDVDERGYGYVDGATPELSIAVWPGERGRGIGTRMLQALLESLEPRFAAMSLSVSADNPAQRLYLRLGFQLIDRQGGSLVMRRASSR